LRYTFLTIHCLIAACTVFLQTAARAQLTTIENDDYTQPTIYKMTVSPAAEPRPALKYHFLVPPVDQIKANAATYYYKCMVIEGPDWVGQAGGSDDVYAWQTTPLEQLPAAARELLNKIDSDSLESLKFASRCDRCDWLDNIREHGVGTLLPQAQKSRGLASVLALRARVQTADNHLDDAIETLGWGYAMSRHLAHGTSLVQDLIGIAFHNPLDEQTRTVIAAKGSPNLYWAITDLAATPIELRRAISYETKMWDFTVHELADLDRRVFSPEEALKLAQRIAQVNERGPQSLPTILLWAMQLQREAREYLLASGYTKSKLDAMPLLQVALLYRWTQFQIVRDNSFKWLFLPDNEIHAEIARSRKAVEDAAQKDEGQPFTSLLGVIYPSHYAALRNERHVSALRIVEALRLYAAEHRRWPTALADIKVVPIPDDPYTQKPFEYSVQNGVAILACPADLGTTHSPNSGPVRYELTLRQTKNQ
jgi:hypothetical protein